ncbi:MAG: hypothetical protein DWQ05_01775 [Calditrichaeota bacterium]|nr:MAG: hypothetical protein DWQ05_01775 [Calditrichota bacterium]
MEYFKKSLLVAFVLSGLIFMGCEQNNPAEPEDTEQTELESLDKVDGGYTTDDELPGFGETTMVVEYEETAMTVSDDYSAAVDSGLTESAIPAYFLRLTWGQLLGDSTASTTVDWSGSIEINKGVLAIQKAVRFEQGDYIHLPRESRQALEFTSLTNVHFDGISLIIVDNDTTDSDGLLTVNAGPYSRTFSFAELDGIELIDSVDDLGNEFSIVGHAKEVHPFAGGFFAGKWLRRAGVGGTFEGRWINSLGTSIGYMKGIWGQNLRGMNVMFGKYIHRDGTFGGLLAGEWGSDDMTGESGWMKGRWINRSRTTIGQFKGVWRSSLEVEGKGFFHGRWNRNDGAPEGEEATN